MGEEVAEGAGGGVPDGSIPLHDRFRRGAVVAPAVDLHAPFLTQCFIGLGAAGAGFGVDLAGWRRRDGCFVDGPVLAVMAFHGPGGEAGAAETEAVDDGFGVAGGCVRDAVHDLQVLEVGFPGRVDGSRVGAGVGGGGEKVLADGGPGTVGADEEGTAVGGLVFEDGFDAAGWGVL